MKKIKGGWNCKINQNLQTIPNKNKNNKNTLNKYKKNNKLKGCFEISKEKIWKSRGRETKEGKTIGAKPNNCWVHALPHYEGDTRQLKHHAKSNKSSTCWAVQHK